VENFNLDTSTASAVYSLIDAVDSESIADEFDIGTSAQHMTSTITSKSLCGKELIPQIR
jgi:hypothetical protein